MSKFSYDDLPWDVADQLVCLDFELQEGDITQKGYEKKRNQLLEPYQDLIAAAMNRQQRQQQQQQRTSPTHQDEQEPEQETNDVTSDMALVDLGPEPSAADVTDFLDFLPSPSHSPAAETKGAALMQEHHQQQQQQQQQPPTEPMAYMGVHRPPPPSHAMPTSVASSIRPQQLQQQQQPRPFMPDNSFNRLPPQNYMNRPMFDPRMGNAPPPRPMYGNPYPGRPPMSNGFGRPPPPLPSNGQQQQQQQQINPMYRPSPPPPPQSMYNSYRPPSHLNAINGPPTPTHIVPPFSQQHNRSPSLDSKHDVMLNKSYPQSIRQMDMVAEPDSLQSTAVDWETSSASWRPTTQQHGLGREASIMSAASTSRMRQSVSSNSLLSMVDLYGPATVRRSRSIGSNSNSNSSSSIHGRSRYRDSYMATTFKAIEPAPQPKLMLNDPIDQLFLQDIAGRQMTPLKGRSVPFTLYDADNKTVLTDFPNLAHVLRFRSAKSGDRLKDAFSLVDARGKEPQTLSWEKLNARAEKIAHTIRLKGNVKPGDRIALIYRKSEVLEFIPALFGCFLAGVTAVPINAAEDLSELSFILTLANIYLILTTDHNQRAFTKDMQAKSIEFPPSISWWKTNDMGTWHPSKKASDYPPIKVPEIAYIEYAKASNGELKGVTVSHASIMEQCATFQAATTETIITTDKNEGSVHVQPKKNARSPETVVSYFEPRQQIGLILSVLHSVYAGNNMVFASGSIVDTPAIWIYVLSKYKATMALADYPALKSITKYYQAHPKEVNAHSKKVTPDLSSLRYLIVDTNTVRPELNQDIADKLLRPLGNTDNPLEVVCPVLSLPEHGGKILSMRDNLGPAYTEACVETEDMMTEDGGRQISRPAVLKRTQSVLAPGNSRDVFACLFDAQALRLNKVMVVAAGADAQKEKLANEAGRICVESFGFCMPKASVAIVDPDTATLCPADTVGEIWVNSPTIDGSFWALPKHTESIFHARPLMVPSESCYPEVYGESFLRTGLCGTLIGGRLFVLGSYEERIRQQRLGADFGLEDIYYASELLNTVTKRARIEQCTVFEVLVKDQHLPVVVCESNAQRSDIARVATEIDEALIEFHGLRAYAIVFAKENGLPRQLIHGRRAIHPLLTKRCFLQGQLSIRYIKIDVDRTIFNLAENEDPSKDLWLSGMAYDKAIRTGAIVPHPQHQHTGMEKVRVVVDERTEYDISRFTNIVDILQWRTTMNPEEVCYTVSTQNGSTTINTKPYTWRKLSYKSATVATYLTKKGLKRGAKVLVMMPFGIDYILCIYACLAMGVVPVPVEPVDPQQQPQRISEFAMQMVDVARELSVAAIVVNAGGDDVMKHSAVKAAIKMHIHKGYKLPEVINIAKAPKHHKMLGKESGFMVRPDWITHNRHAPTIVLIQTTSDGRRCYTHLSHDTILNQCRTQKTTCQMRFQRGIVTTGLGTYEGLGFLHALFCGVYVGCSTVLIPSADFYMNPACFFESLQRYKTKDAFLTNALVQFAMNRMNNNDCKHITLKGVQNLMLANDGRPKPLLYQHMARYFARQKLDKESINTVYSHAANPMITTRSYMLMEPITISIDPYWLRQGIIRTLSPEEEHYGILLNDSGIVPSNTMVAIVNPETLTICPSNVVGEIWVSSDSNATTLFSMDDATHQKRFEATIAGNDPNIKYMRTGDFGFLWNVRRRVVDNRSMQQPMMLEEGQCLYVLGPANETIVRNGLIYFPVDVELSIERCHPAIPSGGSIVFQHKDEVVAVVSVKANEHALAVVPLVVNAVLDYHSFLVDTVIVVHPSNFPRSRFGDKMRRKAMIAFADKKLTAIYVKRITNQHQSIMLPQWSQSQLSVTDMHNNDSASVINSPRAHSISDLNSDFDRQSIPQQLARQDTASSRLTHSNTGSAVHTPI